MNRQLLRDQILCRGANSLATHELIAYLTNWQPCSAVSAWLEKVGGLRAIENSFQTQYGHGLSSVRAARLHCAVEIGRRFCESRARVKIIASAEQVFDLFWPRMAGAVQESCWVLGVDTRNQLVVEHEVTRGGLTGVEVHPRDVFRPLIRGSAVAGVLVLNHPSGDPTPSEDDLILTSRISDAGKALGIQLLDHVIVAQSGFHSMRAETEMAFISGI